MNISALRFRTAAAALIFSAVVACTGPNPPDPAATPALRGALFDTILASTERREAFSPVKNERLGFDPFAAMNDGGVPETIDDGSWLMEWLEDNVLGALGRGDEYSNNVPFKHRSSGSCGTSATRSCRVARSPRETRPRLTSGCR